MIDVAAAAFLGEDFWTRMPPEFFDLFRDFSGGMELFWPLWCRLPHLRRSARAKEALRKTVPEASSPSARRRRGSPPTSSRCSPSPESDDELIADLILMLVWAVDETTDRPGRLGRWSI